MIKINNILDVTSHIDDMKAVIFDLDDTLYSEKEYVKSGYLAVAQIIPKVCNAAQKLWSAFEKGKSAIDAVLLDEGIYSDELKFRCLDAYRAHIPDIHLYDGVQEMLREIKNKGLYIGVITDGRPLGQRLKLKALNLYEYVDSIIVTDELGGVEYRKPNETAYALMRDNFGLQFSEMCYVGDNLKKDFISPDKLNMRSIYFMNKDGLYYESLPAV